MINSVSPSYAKDLLKILRQQKREGAPQSDTGTEDTPVTYEDAESRTTTTESTPQTDSPSQPAPSAESDKINDAKERQVDQLSRIDTEVRSHEAAHQAVGGSLVGGATFSYQTGPDGKQYAIGGDVPVDMSTSGDSPEEVIAKMLQVQAAALAPANPSGQDYAVAAQAAQIAAQAQIIMMQKLSEENQFTPIINQKQNNAAMAYAKSMTFGTRSASEAFSAVA